jgi:UDP-glucose 4-epimerase
VKALITGAGGFLGQAIAQHFGALGWEVIGLGRRANPSPELAGMDWVLMELPDPLLITLLREQQPDLLIHAASNALVGRSLDYPLDDFEQSVRVWAHTLEALRQAAPECRSILLSSAAVYGNPEQLPVGENAHIAPISPYGCHKRMCEDISAYYQRLYGLQTCVARIFSAYGPGLRRQVVWDICRKAIEQQVVELMGTGEETRDFIHAVDVAQALGILAERGDFQAGVYNIASGESTMIASVAEQVVAALGKPVPIRFSGQRREGDPLFWRADIGRLTSLGFSPGINFSAGLRDVVAWAAADLQR